MASGRKGKTVRDPSAQKLEEQMEGCSTYLMGFLNNATMRYDSYVVCKFLLRYSALQVKAGIASGLLTPNQVDEVVSEFTRDIFRVPDNTN